MKRFPAARSFLVVLHIAIGSVVFASDPSQSPPQVADGLAWIARGQDTVAVGVRRYTSRVGTRFESTLERLVLAPGGRFHMELLDVDGQRPERMDGPHRESFKRLAARYAGTLARRIRLERDFRIRDVDLAKANYQVDVAPETVTFLGRPARVVSVRDRFQQHGSGDRPSYSLTVDLETGFIVQSTEKNAEGAVVGEMAYMSIDFHPDLTPYNVTTFDFEGRVQPGSTRSDPGCVVFEPSWLPPGFVRAGEVLTEVGAGALRMKVLQVIYTDGIEHIALFENQPLEKPPWDHSPGRDEPYEVRINYFGSVALSDFIIGDTALHVESKVAPADLATVIESLAQR